MKVAVLLSTYNGEKYLKEQLDSLVAQTIRPTKILIRDDGSTDGTLKILQEYSKKYDFIEYYLGENIKTTKSFWELIRKAEGFDYYSLCDQDDVWFDGKLEKAISLLSLENNNIPLLYCGKYVLADENLNPMDTKISSLYRFTDFPHSLMYHTAPGCTFVFNSKAREKIVEYNLDKEYYVIHDAIIHKVTALFGKVILDEEPNMYYRQHSNNAIGMDSGKLKILFTRIKNFSSGKLKNYRSKSAKSLLNVYGEECNLENKHLLTIVAGYKENPQYKKELLKLDCFNSDLVNDTMLKLLIILNYI